MRAVAALTIVAAGLLSPGLAAADSGAPQPAQAATTVTADTTAPSTITPPPAGTREVVTVAAPKPSSLDEVVCKSTPATTGTRLGAARECRTAREWNDRQQKSQDVLHHVQSIGTQQPLKSLGGK